MGDAPALDATALIREASIALSGDSTDADIAWWLLFALGAAESRDALMRATARNGWRAPAVEAAIEVLKPLDGWDWPLVDRALESSVDRDATGAFFTPAPLARRLADALLARCASPQRLVDPACGSGGLLHAALDALIERGADPAEALNTLWGFDINPVAAKVARWRLQSRAGTLLSAGPEDGPHIGHRDALCGITPTNFDAVIANPPFGNAIEKKSGRTDTERLAWAERYPEAATGAYDKASLFVAWALRHTKTGAPVAMLVPRALLSAPYAAALRERCEALRPLAAWLPVERGDWFNAASVHVVGLVWAGEQRADGLAVRRTGEAEKQLRWAAATPSQWCVHTSPWRGWASLPDDWQALGDLADVSASAAVGEAYDWRTDITEAEESDGRCFRLVTSGAIDPLSLLWGKRQRYLKARYDRPVVSVRALSERRRRQAGTPKVLVPGLSAALEAASDVDGRYIGAVATLCVLLRGSAPSQHFSDPVFSSGQGLLFGSCDAESSIGASAQPSAAAGSAAASTLSGDALTRSLRSLTHYLNAAPARAWYLAHYGAQALAGGSVQLTAAKLRSVPVPSWVLTPTATDELRPDALLAAAALVDAASDQSAELPIKRPPPPEWKPPKTLRDQVARAGFDQVWSALQSHELSAGDALWSASVVLSSASLPE